MGKIVKYVCDKCGKVIEPGFAFRITWYTEDMDDGSINRGDGYYCTSCRNVLDSIYRDFVPKNNITSIREDD